MEAPVLLAPKQIVMHALDQMHQTAYPVMKPPAENHKREIWLITPVTFVMGWT
jgi:hypothetical protein